MRSVVPVHPGTEDGFVSDVDPALSSQTNAPYGECFDVGGLARLAQFDCPIRPCRNPGGVPTAQIIQAMTQRNPCTVVVLGRVVISLLQYVRGVGGSALV